jgi:tripartite-type tricarboxylate transporter receptor subunit TctC
MLARRKLLGAAALGLVGGPGAFSRTARAQGLETARIIVGFPPGGTTDVMARKVADKLRGPYARTVIVENRPGAGGQLGVVALKDAPADGSVMLLTPSSMLSIYPYTYRKLQYALEDVGPVSLAMYTHHVLSVGPAVSADVKSLQDFFAWAKANPDKAAYGSPGAGSMPHLIGVLVGKASGTELRHVAYRGSAPGIQDLLGGQIAAFAGPVGDVITQSKAGKVRVLAVSGAERNAFLPDVPTMREQGMSFAVREWYAFFMPARAGAATAQRAAAALKPVLAEAEVVEFARRFGLEAQASTPQELAGLLRTDATEWGELVKQTGFTADS